MKDFHELLDAAGELSKRLPEDNLAHLLFGDVLLGAGKYEQAEKAYRAALSLQSGDAGALQGLAQALFGQRKFAAALVTVEELLAQSSPRPRAVLLHSRLLMMTGERRRGAEQYHAAVTLDSSLQTAWMDMLISQMGEKLDETRSIVLAKLRGDESADTPEGAEEEAASEPDGPVLTFRDIGGMADVKEEIRLKLLYPVQYPDIYKTYGKRTGGGVLLYGPPGCGKTLIARATAGELNAAFVSMEINEIMGMYYGETEKQMHECFVTARQKAPCVLFIDEVDAMGARRDDTRSSDSRRWVNQFLTEMDGINVANEGILVLAATNAPWHLDSALRRPGRFDRLIYVPPPDLSAREEILRIVLQHRLCNGVKYGDVAKCTKGFSGADLAAVVDLASEKKIQHAMATGTTEPLTTKDLREAASRHRPTTGEWLSHARQRAGENKDTVTLDFGAWAASVN